MTSTYRALPLCHPPCLSRQVFLYLDRAFVVSNPGTLSVFQLGLRQLRYQLEALPHVSGPSRPATVDGDVKGASYHWSPWHALCLQASLPAL